MGNRVPRPNVATLRLVISRLVDRAIAKVGKSEAAVDKAQIQWLQSQVG